MDETDNTESWDDLDYFDDKGDEPAYTDENGNPTTESNTDLDELNGDFGEPIDDNSDNSDSTTEANDKADTKTEGGLEKSDSQKSLDDLDSYTQQQQEKAEEARAQADKESSAILANMAGKENPFEEQARENAKNGNELAYTGHDVSLLTNVANAINEGREVSPEDAKEASNLANTLNGTTGNAHSVEDFEQAKANAERDISEHGETKTSGISKETEDEVTSDLEEGVSPEIIAEHTANLTASQIQSIAENAVRSGTLSAEDAARRAQDAYTEAASREASSRAASEPSIPGMATTTGTRDATADYETLLDSFREAESAATAEARDRATAAEEERARAEEARRAEEERRRLGDTEYEPTTEEPTTTESTETTEPTTEESTETTEPTTEESTETTDEAIDGAEAPEGTETDVPPLEVGEEGKEEDDDNSSGDSGNDSGNYYGSDSPDGYHEELSREDTAVARTVFGDEYINSLIDKDDGAGYEAAVFLANTLGNFINTNNIANVKTAVEAIKDGRLWDATKAIAKAIIGSGTDIALATNPYHIMVAVLGTIKDAYDYSRAVNKYGAGSYETPKTVDWSDLTDPDSLGDSETEDLEATSTPASVMKANGYSMQSKNGATNESDWNEGLVEDANNVVSDWCKKVILYTPYVRNAVKKWSK